MAETKQTWVIRYLRIDSETRKLPCSFSCRVESNSDGQAKFLAMEKFQHFAAENKLEVLFLESEKL